jgi:hypothetical protein
MYLSILRRAWTNSRRLGSPDFRTCVRSNAIGACLEPGIETPATAAEEPLCKRVAGTEHRTESLHRYRTVEPINLLHFHPHCHCPEHARKASRSSLPVDAPDVVGNQERTMIG